MSALTDREFEKALEELRNMLNEKETYTRKDMFHYQSYCYACAMIIPDGQKYCRYHQPKETK